MKKGAMKDFTEGKLKNFAQTWFTIGLSAGLGFAGYSGDDIMMEGKLDKETLQKYIDLYDEEFQNVWKNFHG